MCAAKITEELIMGDVLKWEWHDCGVPVAGGEGIVLKDTTKMVEKHAYSIEDTNIAELTQRVTKIWLVTNIFKDRDFKLTVDKKIVMKDGKPLIIKGVVQLA